MGIFEEKFERENYSYKIVVKESYRENGKVKQKQVVMGTFHWFDFLDHYVYPDDWFYKKLEEIFPDKTQEQLNAVCDIIEEKVGEIETVESKLWTTSKEYKIHNKHLEMIRKYESKKVVFDELYGKDIFEQVYDIHLKVMNQELYEQLPQIRAERKRLMKRNGNTNANAMRSNKRNGMIFISNTQVVVTRLVQTVTTLTRRKSI